MKCNWWTNSKNSKQSTRIPLFHSILSFCSQSINSRLVEAEGAERYRALRDALHAANARDAHHAETLAKQHAAQDAEVAAQLARVNEMQRELELRASQAQGDANALRARIAELSAAHQTQLADQSAAFNAQLSELRAMMTSEVSARDRRVAQLSEQLAIHDRESETLLTKHKQDAEYKYDLLSLTTNDHIYFISNAGLLASMN